MKILVVEDTELAAMIAVSLLKSAGHTADIAGSGEDAIMMAKKNEYQLILMDIGLPGIDGFTAASRIFAFAPDIKIIGVTAHAIDEKFYEKAKESCFIDIISKPLTKAYIDKLPSLLSAL